eukprot:4984680-Prymnesium_polylepis.1
MCVRVRCVCVFATVTHTFGKKGRSEKKERGGEWYSNPQHDEVKSTFITRCTKAKGMVKNAEDKNSYDVQLNN